VRAIDANIFSANNTRTLNFFVSLENCAEKYFVATKWEEISAGINFCEFFFGHIAGTNFCEFDPTGDFGDINFRELSLKNHFAGINFRKSALFTDFAGVNLTFALRSIFSTTLVYGFENNLSKN